MPETFFAYHVVTERPMPPRICLDEGRPNGVRARVDAQRGIVEDIWANPEKYREEELPYPVKVALRELALEKVRREKYPATPPGWGACMSPGHGRRPGIGPDTLIGWGGRCLGW